MLDYGTLLPFKFVEARTPECWCAVMLQLNEERSVVEGGVLTIYPERWAYFLWLPLLHGDDLGAPDLWEVVDEIPYGKIFTTVWNSQVYLLDESDVDRGFFGRHLLERGECEDWLRTTIVEMIVEADRDPAWGEFWEQLQADTCWKRQ